jgi:hypothetical protein
MVRRRFDLEFWIDIQTFVETACDWNNTRLNFAVPVYGILCDGSTFEFFLFDGSTKPYSFSRGCLSGDPPIFRNGLRLEDFTKTETPRPFIHTLRPICEITFDLLLRGYISSLNAYHSRSSKRSEKEQKPRKSLDKWVEAVKFAEEALKKFREADAKRHADLIDESNEIAQEAMKSLNLRYGLSASAHIAFYHLSLTLALKLFLSSTKRLPS